MRELPMWGTTSVSGTVPGHVPCLVTVETLPVITPGSVTPSTPCSVVGFLVVRFVGVWWGWYPLVSAQLVESNTVGLLAEGVSSSSTRYSERKS